MVLPVLLERRVQRKLVITVAVKVTDDVLPEATAVPLSEMMITELTEARGVVVFFIPVNEMVTEVSAPTKSN